MSEEERLRTELYGKITELYQKRGKARFEPGKTLIRYCSPIFDDQEVNAAVESLLDGWLGVGKAAAKFEEEFCKYVGTTKLVLTNSGSSANLLAVSAAANHNGFKISKGDEAITPAMTFPSVINPLIQNGIKPVLVDSEIGKYAISTTEMEKALSERTKMVMLPHMMGNPCDMDFITEFCEENNLLLVEDSCDALGAEYRGKKTGTFGELGTFSFYASHHMSMGEGGAVATDDEEMEPIVRSFRDWGRIGAGQYMYNHIGYNLKPIDLQAAMGLIQLKRLGWFVKKRRENFKTLYEGFKAMERYFMLPQATKKSEPSWFGFPLTIRDDAGFKRDELSDFLWKANIENRPLLAGNIVDQPAYRKADMKVIGNLKNSEKVMHDGFFIGLYPGIDEEIIKYVVSKFKEFLAKQ
ncbi:aminotransferase class I/II-fold pyridoxal phosphate-dependent enzyme [Candidatus Woesearchaeota archaeon]|nr:aminotransferase class I/II-fold pyridoxal phosphate-dependent enzyme [Candidatus Woesearchaeota archaeon]